MKSLKSIIKEEINKYLLKEVRYIDNAYRKINQDIYRPYLPYKSDSNERYYQQPIKNNETIRVFHKCNLDTAIKFALHGLSGKVYAARAFSYENGMNPKGLFVSTDFNLVKDKSFASYGVIIEFSAKASDLDTPVWNNSDSYFGQGSNPIPFRNKEERDKQKAKYNNDALNIKDETYWDMLNKRDKTISYDYIRKSDNPAMAKNIFLNNEHQALFVGDLNPNMIKRFWVRQKGTDNYIPYKRGQFLRKFKEKGNNYFDDRVPCFFKPNDDFSFDEMAREEYMDGIYRYKREGIDFETFKNTEFKKYTIPEVERMVEKHPEDLSHYFWPKQIKQLIGDEKYNEIYGGIMGI